MSNPAAEEGVPEWTLADRLRKARETAGLDQQELADRIGISRRSVTSYEHGGAPRRPVLLSWALATGVPLEWLVENSRWYVQDADQGQLFPFPSLLAA